MTILKIQHPIIDDFKVSYGFFTRLGGTSKKPFDTLNCSFNSEDLSDNVKKNLEIVDLTGAGDLFAAGFLHGYINKLTLKECLEKGTEMSSRVIQQIGARL